VRAEQNQYLLESIREVSQHGVRVVLTQGLVRSHGLVRPEDQWKEEPNIFDRRLLPDGVALGYINLPVDKREIPLCKNATAWDASETITCDSFALQIVDQYEQTIHIEPRTRAEGAIVSAIRDGVFVCGSFVAEQAFPKISAHDLLNDENAKQRCRGRIVMFGGTWHESGGRGPLIESFASPVGRIPGLHLHANYVEALLDDRFQPRVSLQWAVLIDLIAGLIIYSLYHLVPQWAQLDFVHLVYEHFRT
jgi:CHASE2 domain-containing sensor protein